MAKKSKEKLSFTKIILALIMFSYFVGVVFGVWICKTDSTQYTTLAALIGTPTATAIGFYAWKAKCENVLKYKKEETKKDNVEVAFNPENIMP